MAVGIKRGLPGEVGSLQLGGTGYDKSQVMSKAADQGVQGARVALMVRAGRHPRRAEPVDPLDFDETLPNERHRQGREPVLDPGSQSGEVGGLNDRCACLLEQRPARPAALVRSR